MGNLLTTGRNVIFNSNSFTIQTLSYAIFNFFLTMVLSQGAPKLDMTLLIGNPEMSLGDVANDGRQIGHAVLMGPACCSVCKACSPEPCRTAASRQ